MKTLPVGVQVYSVRDDAAKDFKGTMQKLKDMGYDGVELAGLYGMEADEIRKILDEVGIPAISAHVPFAELRSDPDGTVAKYVSIGCKWIAVPYLMEEDRPGTPGFEKTMADLVTIGEACRKHGVKMLYHNHDFEFTAKVDGMYALDYMYANISADLLETELDTCWVNVGGENPAAYVRKYTGRAPIVHLKDFYKEGHTANMYELIGIETEKKEEKEAGFFEFRPVGSGMQNFPEILEASIDAGAQWVIVEQDQSNDCPPMEAVKKSRDYLKSLGW